MEDLSGSIKLHVAGATVRHQSPFSNVSVPILETELSSSFYEKWVVPFYRVNLVTITDDYQRSLREKLSVTSRPKVNFQKSLKALYPEIGEPVITTLLSDFNWRSRITGAYFAAIKKVTRVQEHIGKLLLRSDVSYAGSGYCLALAQFNTTPAREYLQTYLTYYLTRPDLRFDQGKAMAAIAYLDRKNETAYLDEFMEKWYTFAKDKKHGELEGCIERFNQQMAIIAQLRAENRS